MTASPSIQDYDSFDEVRFFNRGSYLGALYPAGFPSRLRIIKLSQVSYEQLSRQRGALNALWKQNMCVHLVLEAGPGLSNRLKRFFRLILLMRKFDRHRFSCWTVGVVGSLERPQVVMPLRRNIVNYANTVTFRVADSPWRLFLKRLSGLLPVGFTWSESVVLIGVPKE